MMFRKALAALALAALALAASLGAMASIAPALAQAPASAALTRLNPNTATPAQLSALPHMTPTLVNAIQAKKPFKRTSELTALLSASLKPEQLAEVYPKLFVPIDLNSATDEEIGAIPGMSRRMIHEFEEYRPYKSIDQFNKEIGKYVPPEEVARLRSYVTIN